MPDTMPEGYHKTRYPYVFTVGEVVYYRLRTHDNNAKGKPVWRQVRYGLGTPKQAADARDDAQRREDAIRNGQLDPREASIHLHESEMIEAVLDDYMEHVAQGSRDAQHQKTTRRYIERCYKWCGIRCLRDFDAAKVDAWLKVEFRRLGKTTHHPIAAVKGLLNWAHNTHRLGFNPLTPIKKVVQEVERPSRALTREQFDRILAVVPRRRACFYLLAATVGIRWREIARLKWGMIDLDQGAVILEARITKAKRADILPIPPETVQALRDLKPKAASLPDRLFRAEPRIKTWKRDLVAAGICWWEDSKGQRAERVPQAQERIHTLANYRDETGRQYDRKCLRLSYGTWLYQSGVDLRDAQKLMRHKDPALTATIYTQIGLDNLRSAQAKIGSVDKPTRQQAG